MTNYAIAKKFIIAFISFHGLTVDFTTMKQAVKMVQEALELLRGKA